VIVTRTVDCYLESWRERRGEYLVGPTQTIVSYEAWYALRPGEGLH